MSVAGSNVWPSKRLKYAVSLRRTRVDGTDNERPYVGLEQIESGTGRLVPSASAAESARDTPTAAGESLSNTFEPGDVLFGKLRPYLAKAWIAEFAGRCTTELVVMKPTDFDSRFLLYVCISRGFVDAVDASTFGSKMPRADWDFIGSMPVPMPTLRRQRAIADYLDRETALLDGLVAAKERLLGLLAEKLRAFITHAVTRGLDSSVPLRDSGIPWLGEIPAHWELIPLRFLVDIVGGATPDTGKAEFWDGDIPWVSPKDMKRDEIKDAEDHVSALALSSSALRLIDPVVVLIVVRGMILAHSFPTAVTTQPVTINQDMKALRCRELLEPHYLRDFLRGLEAQLVSIAEESAHGTRKLETEMLGRFQVCVPPIDEQRAIVAHIAAETAKLDALRVATERTIALLKERRAALIAAAVTGRLHILEAA
jgi:type I restriction enzyme S subunit